MKIEPLELHCTKVPKDFVRVGPQPFSKAWEFRLDFKMASPASAIVLLKDSGERLYAWLGEWLGKEQHQPPTLHEQINQTLPGLLQAGLDQEQAGDRGLRVPLQAQIDNLRRGLRDVELWRDETPLHPFEELRDRITALEGQADALHERLNLHARAALKAAENTQSMVERLLKLEESAPSSEFLQSLDNTRAAQEIRIDSLEEDLGEVATLKAWINNLWGDHKSAQGEEGSTQGAVCNRPCPDPVYCMEHGCIRVETSQICSTEVKSTPEGEYHKPAPSPEDDPKTWRVRNLLHLLVSYWSRRPCMCGTRSPILEINHPSCRRCRIVSLSLQLKDVLAD
jgi:hypothetical protein